MFINRNDPSPPIPPDKGKFESLTFRGNLVLYVFYKLPPKPCKCYIWGGLILIKYSSPTAPEGGGGGSGGGGGGAAKLTAFSFVLLLNSSLRFIFYW